MNERPLVSVVVLNWNGDPFVGRCLASLLSQTYKPLELIVVDNASTDGSPELIRKNFPEVKLIVNEKNLGFAAGNNVGIRASRGKYIMVLNNDAHLKEDGIEKLTEAIEKDEKYGACASKIVLDSSKGVIDSAGIAIGLDGLSIGRGRLDREDRYDQETEVFFASGCACLLRREMLEDIGLFDDDFFAYAEDTDLGWRARLAGWKCIYCPSALVYHRHSASSGSYSPLKAFLVERNRMWVAVKSFPLFLFLYGQTYTLQRYFFQTYGALTGKGAAGRFTRERGKVHLLAVLLKVYLSLLTSSASLLRKRRAIRRKRRISIGEIYGLFRQYGVSAREIALRE